MHNTVIKHCGHLGTLEKCRKHSGEIFFISSYRFQRVMTIPLMDGLIKKSLTWAILVSTGIKRNQRLQTLLELQNFYKLNVSCSRNIKTARVRSCSLERTLFTLDHFPLWANDSAGRPVLKFAANR